MTHSKLEKLSEYAHDAWSGWMEHLFSKCKENSDGSAIIPKESVERWKRQMNTLYEDLPEEEKRSDRKEADKMIKIFEGD
jgi:hypothetical protein